MQFPQQISMSRQEQNPFGCACYTPVVNPESKLFLKRGQANGVKKDLHLIHKPVMGGSAPRQMQVQSAKISLKRQHFNHMSLRSSDVNNSTAQDKLRQTTPAIGYYDRFPEDIGNKPRSVQLISSWADPNYNRNIYECNRQMMVYPQMVQPYTYTQTAASFTSQSSPFPYDYYSPRKSPVSCNSTMIAQPIAQQSKANAKITKKISFHSQKQSQDDYLLNLNLDGIFPSDQKPKQAQKTGEKQSKISASNLLSPHRSIMKKEAISIKRLRDNKHYLQRMDDVMEIKSQVDENQSFDDKESVVLTRLKQYNSSVNPAKEEEQPEDFSFTTEKFKNMPPVLSTIKPTTFRQRH